MLNLQRAIVLGGRTGLLGQALSRELRRIGSNVFAPTRDELNVFSTYDFAAYIDLCQPDIVFNTIAYTQVDKAEDEPEMAQYVNEGLCQVLGNVLKTRPCRCLSVSTDFVFAGEQSRPYSEQTEPSPKTVYGKTKLAGERCLLEAIPEKVLIARTAWLFGPDKTNFVHKILTLAKERSEISVVSDQVGSPTYTEDLAEMSIALSSYRKSGIYHLVNSGMGSWFDLASYAVEQAGINCSVKEISSSQFAQKATRPSYSVLDNSKYTLASNLIPRNWEEALQHYIKQYLDSDHDLCSAIS